MALAQSLTGLAGATVLLVWGAVALAPRHRSGMIGIAALMAAMLPVGGIPVAGYVRGFTGDLSLTSVALLALMTAGEMGGPRFPSGSRATSALVLCAAIVLYPAALGLGPFDTYRLGYFPSALLVALAIVTALAWRSGSFVLVACVSAAVAGYALQLLESRNLWDYLIDPWLTLYAIYDLRRMRRIS